MNKELRFENPSGIGLKVNLYKVFFKFYVTKNI